MEYRDLLEKIVSGRSLSLDEAEALAMEVINGKMPDVVVSAALAGLRAKGESIEEIAGFAMAMKKVAVKIDGGDAIDVVGTGGDGHSTINVSTAVAILLSTFHSVAKHGNRAISSKSGSADVLEVLGYKVAVEPSRAEELLKRTNFAFLFAPLYHPAMKNVMPVRKALGIRTIFNVLGPLVNPASPKRVVIGAYSRSCAEKMAYVLSLLGVDRAFVVHGEPGIDEASPEAMTHIYEVKRRGVEYYRVEPTDFGVKPISLTKVVASCPEDSAVRIIRASKGLDESAETFIKVNASIALVLIDRAKDFRDGVEVAEQLLPHLLSKIEEIVKVNGDVTKLRRLAEKAGVA